MQERERRWLRLDNAALIFPAARRKHWSNVFRISFTLRDEIDPALLQTALEHVAARFPSVCVRLRRGLFWYRLEELPAPPEVAEDGHQPLLPMSLREIRRCAIRVRYYRERLAVEFFHAVTDGTGAMIFTKTLAAEYVRLRYGAAVPCTCDIKDLRERVPESEMRDCFLEHAGPVSSPRDDGNVYRVRGQREPDRFLHVTLGMLDSAQLHARAKALGVTVTAYLTALLLDTLLEMQAEDQPKPARRRPVKVQIPVNLRKLYGGDTMRNFVAVANVGVDPRRGDYSFEELVKSVHHQMQLTITDKEMRAIFTPNVRDARNPFLKVVPLFLKNIIMRAVFDAVGERVACLTLSNLGNVALPEEMCPFVARVEFVLGPQAAAPYNCSVTSWQGTTFLNVSRNSVAPRLERGLFTRLVKQGLHVRVESNDSER